MHNIKLIQGKRSGLSCAETIKHMLPILDEHNKIACLELIVTLEPHIQTIFLNAYLHALERQVAWALPTNLPHENPSVS